MAGDKQGAASRLWLELCYLLGGPRWLSSPAIANSGSLHCLDLARRSKFPNFRQLAVCKALASFLGLH